MTWATKPSIVTRFLVPGSRFLVPGLLCGALGFCGGCQPSAETPQAGSSAASVAHSEDEHDHDEEAAAVTTGESHEEHDTLAEIVPQLKQHCETVRDAFAAGKPHDADDAIHSVAHLCKHLPAAGQTAQLPAADMVELSMAAEKLFNAFHAMHEGFHDDAEGKSYDDVKDDINQSLEKLAELAGKAGA